MELACRLPFDIQYRLFHRYLKPYTCVACGIVNRNGKRCGTCLDWVCTECDECSATNYGMDVCDNCNDYMCVEKCRVLCGFVSSDEYNDECTNCICGNCSLKCKECDDYVCWLHESNHAHQLCLTCATCAGCGEDAKCIKCPNCDEKCCEDCRVFCILCNMQMCCWCYDTEETGGLCDDCYHDNVDEHDEA